MEEYYLGKNSWSTNTSDWKQRFEVGDAIIDPVGDWNPSTAEQYIDQQIATEAATRLAQDTYLGNEINTIKKNKIYLTGSILSQNQINQTDTIYVIKDDLTLGENITIPANCVLEFEGGSISGEYTITGQNTKIEAGLVKIFNVNIILAGTWAVFEVYPEWFGAKADGTTDSTSAIQAAFNTKLPCMLNAGAYIVNDSLTFYNSLKGKGTKASRLVCGSSYSSTEFVLICANVGESIDVSDFTLIGNKNVAQQNMAGGLIFTSYGFIKVHSLFIRNCWGHGVCVAYNSTKFTIENNTIFDCSGDGICVLKGCSNGTIVGNQVDACSYGIELEGRDGTSIVPVTNVTISGNQISHGTFTNGQPNLNNAGSVGILLIGAVSCSIIGNTIQQLEDIGIKVIACSRCSICGNSISHIHEPNTQIPTSYSKGWGIWLCVDIFEYRNNNISINSNVISNVRNAIGCNGKNSDQPEAYPVSNPSYSSGVLTVTSSLTPTFAVGEIVAVRYTSQLWLRGEILSVSGNTVTIKTSAQSAQHLFRSASDISITGNVLNRIKFGFILINAFWLNLSGNVANNYESLFERDNCLLSSIKNDCAADSGWQTLGSYGTDVICSISEVVYDMENDAPDIKVLFKNVADYQMIINIPYTLYLNTDNHVFTINVPEVSGISASYLMYRIVCR